MRSLAQQRLQPPPLKGRAAIRSVRWRVWGAAASVAVLVPGVLSACSAADRASEPTTTVTVAGLSFVGPGTTLDTPFCRTMADALSALLVAGTTTDPVQGARLMDEVKPKFRDSLVLAPDELKAPLTTLSNSVQGMVTIKDVFTQPDNVNEAGKQVRAWIAKNCGLST